MYMLYDDVGFLDKRCYKKFGLNEDLLMEHAADGMARYIQSEFAPTSRVLVVCGGGNNGADGIALARLLHGEFDVYLYYAKQPKSQMARVQESRAKSVGVRVCQELISCDIVVDALVGTGFKGEFNEELSKLIEQMNALDAYKIACDVPSGYKFYADISLTMGALKKEMFLDVHKDFVGEIQVINLGVSRAMYEKTSQWHLLEYSDMKLPYRTKKDTHKGSFGHLAVASGSKVGASVLSASAALNFGCGLVTLVGYENEQIPPYLMYSHELPKTTSALALGMGLGYEFSDKELKAFLDNSHPLVGDADIFSMDVVQDILQRKNVVLTPHPKEFVSLLKKVDIADISVEELQNKRFFYVELFCSKFIDVTLLLKGANVIIGQKDRFFVNSYGESSLAKGGSGDVLSGLIGSLLAQGYTPLDSAITASLVHTKLASNYEGHNFSLTPEDLIVGIKKL